MVALRAPVWGTAQHLDPSQVSIRKASGCLTNAVYFVSYPPSPSVPTILLRIYGPSSGSLISRSHELRTLHILSSRYDIGPRIYGTFSNGRIEEYFDSVTLGPSDLRDEKTSRWIGARMAELHSVEITAIEGPLAVRSLEGKSWEIGVKKNVKSWLPVARGVLAHPNVDESDRTVLNLDTFSEGWVRYLRWLSQVEKVEGASRRVFAHNDTQYGNLLKLTGKVAEGMPEHRQVSVCPTTSNISRLTPHCSLSLLTLSMPRPIPLPLTSPTIFTSGLPIITPPRLIYLIFPVIQQPDNGVISTKPISRMLTVSRKCPRLKLAKRA